MNQLLGAQKQDNTSSLLGDIAGTGLGYNVSISITNRFESQYILNQPGLDASKNALKYSETSFGPGYLIKGGEMSSFREVLAGPLVRLYRKVGVA
ncbi:hypothetical protein [Kosakonia sp. R1.Fl]|uniref:hypothetical protein n=1 Tax=Kosakonia sp. R1.Fl TaxID=2928706 RepID=UPI00201D3172|nr:hypothetical protein [Kosakonia sp. R1.Fl]MCL6746937.1 hypothetical protein [Kosakonia sp. R1.Fl]